MLVETKSGQCFVGVFGASSPELEIGITYAWERTTENKNNILPKKSDIKEKMVFKFADVVTVSALWSEEKSAKGELFTASFHYTNIFELKESNLIKPKKHKSFTLQVLPQIEIIMQRMDEWMMKSWKPGKVTKMEKR